MSRSLMVVPLLSVALVGCGDVACSSGAEGCEIPSPCPDLSFTCESGGMTEVYVIGQDDIVTGGFAALASPGDVVMANDQIVVVIEALDHPHYISPTGGGILDMTIRGKEDQDGMRQVFQASGLLPGDAFVFTDLQILDEGDVKAVQVSGYLQGFPESPVATRYEIRPCEPGIRVRTEALNRQASPLSWIISDAWYFGGRGLVPFTPGDGAGFSHPSFGLTTILTAFRDTPYMVAANGTSPSPSYSEISCSTESLSGFHSVEVSAIGLEPTVVQPQDWLAFDRFIGVADGNSVAGAADLALQVREQLFLEETVVVSGKLDAPRPLVGNGPRASVILAEGDKDTILAERYPWTQVFPAEDGTFSVRVPADRPYVVQVEAFGRSVIEADLDVGTSDLTADPIVIPDVGEVTLDVLIDGLPDHAMVFAIPSDLETEESTKGDMFGFWDDCAPFLGNPHGNSPACNRILVQGPTTISMPPGIYDFYTSVGPFSTLGAAKNVAVEPGSGQTVAIDVEMLDIQPQGTLSADFHVHGASSFDAQIGDVDRAKAFLAARIEVVAATEHDTVFDYRAALEELDATDRVILIPGTESTGHILFPLRTDSSFPRVTGHWNFWPIPYDPQGPWRGAAWDELVEPGALFDRQAAAGWDEVDGVIQLNHPIGGIQFGRDFGWGSAAGVKVNQPLVKEFDGSGQSLILHQPKGASYSNDDYHVQEVMNGTNNGVYLGYRTYWHYLLNEGVVKGGTANSDSHTLTENVLGTPRSLVYTPTTAETFDLGVFDADVRAGHILGTSGPIIEAVLKDSAATYAPGTETRTLSGAGTLEVSLSAAPWVPIDELRVIVNGEVVKTLTEGLLTPADPLGTEGIDRGTFEIALAGLLPDEGDAWIVLEAGRALEPNEDLDCDGIPDTGDNNRDGKIDWQDVADLTEDPEVDCFDTVGPMTEPPDPERGSPDWLFRTVTPKGYPLAFTNPWILDLDGNGYSGVK